MPRTEAEPRFNVPSHSEGGVPVFHAWDDSLAQEGDEVETGARESLTPACRPPLQGALGPRLESDPPWAELESRLLRPQHPDPPTRQQRAAGSGPRAARWPPGPPLP